MAERILIVDDEKAIVKGLKYSIEQDGMETDAAYDGEEALELARTNHYDLVLLDLLMPDIDGFDAFRKLREKWPVPIVFITADKSIETIQKAVEIGADDYVTKPFLPIALKERIHGVIYSI